MAAPKKKRKRKKKDEEEPEGFSINDLVSELASTYGESSARLMSDDGLSIHLPGVIPTGSEWLDAALGRGGWPLSRMVLLSGDEGTGKTTLALHACANVQRMGGIAFYVDAEFKLDRDYAAALGVDNDRLIVSQPEHVQESLEIVETTIRRCMESGSNRPILVVKDSLNALPTLQELEDKDNPGTHARAVSKGLRKINRVISKGKVCFMMVSQVREKIGVLFGDKTTTSGGRAPRFHAAIGVKLQPRKALKENGRKIGIHIEAEVWKNQIAPPFRQCQVLIRFGHGVDYVHSLHEALRAGDVAEGGESGWVTLPADEDGDQIKWQGASGLRAKLASADNRRRLITAVRAGYGWGQS